MDLTNIMSEKPDPEVYILYDSTILSSKTRKTYLQLLKARRVARVEEVTAEYTRGFW